MRILSLSSSYPRYPGDGTAPFIKSISETLVKLGHSVTVIAPYDPNVLPIDTNGVTLIRFRYAPKKSWHIMGHSNALKGDTDLRIGALFLVPLFLFSACASLIREIRRNKPDVLYAHWVLPNGLPIALVSKFYNIPMIISLHGSDMYIATKNFLFRLVSRWIFKESKLVTSCSPELLNKALLLGAPLENSILLPYGVDSVMFQSSETQASTFREILKNPADQFIIFTIGRLVHKKGFDVLINAALILKQKFSNVHIVIAGGGALKEQLAEQILSLGLQDSISMIGPISWDKVSHYMNEADIFALPSVLDAKGNMDGLPNVLLEAMACGKPIVASNIGGVPLVIENGVNGFLVSPGNPEELAQKIITLLENPPARIRIGQAARETAAKKLTWSIICQRLESAIKKALRPK